MNNHTNIFGMYIICAFLKRNSLKLLKYVAYKIINYLGDFCEDKCLICQIYHLINNQISFDLYDKKSKVFQFNGNLAKYIYLKQKRDVMNMIVKHDNDKIICNILFSMSNYNDIKYLEIKISNNKFTIKECSSLISRFMWNTTLPATKVRDVMLDYHSANYKRIYYGYNPNYVNCEIYNIKIHIPKNVIK